MFWIVKQNSKHAHFDNRANLYHSVTFDMFWFIHTTIWFAHIQYNIVWIYCELGFNLSLKETASFIVFFNHGSETGLQFPIGNPTLILLGEPCHKKTFWICSTPHPSSPKTREACDGGMQDERSIQMICEHIARYKLYVWVAGCVNRSVFICGWISSLFTRFPSARELMMLVILKCSGVLRVRLRFCFL